MSSVVTVSNLPAGGTFASGSGGGGTPSPISNRRARSAYNSTRLTRGDRISLQSAQRRGESFAAWMRRRNIPS